MKTGVLAIAAALASGAVAHGNHGRRHAHEAFHEKRNYLTGSEPEPTCGCTTIYTTVTGAPTIIGITPTSTYVAPPPPPPTTTTEVAPTSTYSPTDVPTQYHTTCPTPGTYTIPATTITLTSSTTVCDAASTTVGPGTYTTGGVTTIVETSTTVVCPYATVTTSGGVVTSTILTTTYVCPSAGTYTIVPPMTTSYSSSTVWVYPTAATYAPGTYTQPEITTTITETDYVVFCPFTSSTAPEPTYAPAPEPTYAPAPEPTYAPAPEPTYVAKPVSEPTNSGSSNSGSGSSSPLGNDGDQWAVTYTPYDNNGQCKSALEVYADVAMIKAKGFSALRVYSTDCSTLENVGGAAALSGVKMILGIFVSDTGLSGAQDQVSAITSWAKWDQVDMIVVGNECIFNGYATASELAGFISSVSATWRAAGYTGPVTTTEPLNIWQESAGALCGVMDVVCANIHPFFNADVTADQAGSFTKSQLDIVDGLCPGKHGLICETGWPSGGNANGKAVPGPGEQATAVAGIKAAVGGKAAMFSFQNDAWKPLGAFDCERSWGMISLF